MEASLALPVLLYFSMGMVEFGQFFYAKHTVQSAARDGCRQAILGTATQAAPQPPCPTRCRPQGLPVRATRWSFTNPTGRTDLFRHLHRGRRGGNQGYRNRQLRLGRRSPAWASSLPTSR